MTKRKTDVACSYLSVWMMAFLDAVRVEITKELLSDNNQLRDSLNLRLLPVLEERGLTRLGEIWDFSDQAYATMAIDSTVIPRARSSRALSSHLLSFRREELVGGLACLDVKLLSKRRANEILVSLGALVGAYALDQIKLEDSDSAALLFSVTPKGARLGLGLAGQHYEFAPHKGDPEVT